MQLMIGQPFLTFLYILGELDKVLRLFSPIYECVVYLVSIMLLPLINLYKRTEAEAVRGGKRRMEGHC